MNSVDKGKLFRQLHESPDMFVMPNPWDKGTTKIFSKCGFKALATTSGGLAYSLGKKDGLGVTRAEALQHCEDIVSATSLPVSADLENGYGDSPEAVADIIIDAANTGVAGGSIEDYTGNLDSPIYDQTLAVERIHAAHEAAKSLRQDFVLTARCENYVWNQLGIDEVIERLKAYRNAGADVVFAPGVKDLADIKLLVSEVNCPVNVIMSPKNLPYGKAELKDAGVKRLSVGSAIAQFAYGAAIDAITEVSDRGTFDLLQSAIDYDKLESWYEQ